MKNLLISSLISLTTYAGLIPDGTYIGVDKNNKKCELIVSASSTQEIEGILHRDDNFTNLKNIINAKIDLVQRKYEYKLSSTFYQLNQAYSRYELSTSYEISKDRYEYLILTLNSDYRPLVLHYQKDGKYYGLGKSSNQCVFNPEVY